MATSGEWIFPMIVDFFVGGGDEAAGSFILG